MQHQEAHQTQSTVLYSVSQPDDQVSNYSLNGPLDKHLNNYPNPPVTQTHIPIHDETSLSTINSENVEDDDCKKTTIRKITSSTTSRPRKLTRNILDNDLKAAINKTPNDTSLSIMSNLATMRRRNILCDIKLAGVDYSPLNVIIRAHSVVLAASSKFFYRLLVPCRTISPTEMFRFTDLDTETLEIVVDFIYGVIPNNRDINAEQLKLLRKGADTLEIESALQYVISLDIALEPNVAKRTRLQVKQKRKARQVSVRVSVGSSLSHRRQMRPRKTFLHNTQTKRYHLSCTKCNRNFYVFKDLEEHMNAIHDVRLEKNIAIYKCKLCPKLFWSNSVLKAHNKFCNNQSAVKKYANLSDINDFCPFICYICDILYVSRVGLMSHEEKCHLQPPPYPKDLKQEELVNDQIIQGCVSEGHTLCNVGDDDETDQLFVEEYTCFVCNMCFNNNYNLGYHLWHQHKISSRMGRGEPDADGNYKCGLCTRVFKNHQQLFHHRDHHHFRAQKCNMCVRKFDNCFQLLVHLNNDHHGYEYYMCSICGRRCSNVRTVIKHFTEYHAIEATFPQLRGLKIIINTMNLKKNDPLYNAVEQSRSGKISEWGGNWLKKYFPCPHCHQNFSSSDELTLDIKHHLVQESTLLMTLDQREHECQMCGVLYEVQTDLMAHMRSQHQSALICKYCNVVFEDLVKMFKHMRTHETSQQADRARTIAVKQQFTSNASNLKCVHCKEDFKREHFKFLMHNYKQHEHRWFICCICGHGLLTASYMTRHFSTHDISATYPQLRGLKLVIATSNIKSITPLYTALRNSNDNAITGWASKWLYSIFLCTYCNITFESQEMLATHVKTHLEQESEMLALVDQGEYECQHCSKVCVSQNELGKHKLAVHNEGYTCKICGKTFHGAFNLHIHEKQHGNHRPFSCKLCDKTFKQKPHLSDHMKTHSNVREYSCEVCGQQFKLKSTLNQHVLRMHNPTYVRKYACDICGARAHTSSALNNHKAKHSDQRPFTCQQCGKTFKTARHCQKHMKSHVPAAELGGIISPFTQLAPTVVQPLTTIPQELSGVQQPATVQPVSLNMGYVTSYTQPYM